MMRPKWSLIDIYKYVKYFNIYFKINAAVTGSLFLRAAIVSSA